MLTKYISLIQSFKTYFHKSIIALFFILLWNNNVYANHLVGGILEYECINSATSTYRVKLTIWRDCSQSTGFDPTVYIFTQDKATLGFINTVGSGGTLNHVSISGPEITPVPINIDDPCISVPAVCIEQAIYTRDIIIIVPPNGLNLIFQRCCRNASIINISSPNDVGATYVATIPPPADATCNSSATFNSYPPIVICNNFPLVFDHSASDTDGDILVYSLCNPNNGANNVNPIIEGTELPYSYSSVNWLPTFSASNMIGGTPALSINPTTGLLTGFPNNFGQYVVGVCVSEYRGGVLINTTIRDFQFNVTDCEPTLVSALPSATYVCQDYTAIVENLSYGALPIDSVIWDMGDPSTTNDILYTYDATYTYPDSGTYTITLIINPQLSCADTNTALVSVYPTLTPLFSHSTEQCIGDNISFNDLSTTTFGVINQWNWSFGDGSTSNVQNPTHTYTSPGNYSVTLNIQTDKGCGLSYTLPITIYSSSPLSVMPDTTICSLDTIALSVSGGTTYTWEPSAGMIGSNTSSPLVSPDVETTYTVYSNNPSGCASQGTVTVSVLDTLYLSISGNPDFCLGENLNLLANYPSFIDLLEWSPKKPDEYTISTTAVLYPSDTTFYTFWISYGNCKATDYFLATPFMPPTVSLDDSVRICVGDSVRLNISGADNYEWLNSQFISDKFISNPYVFPIVSTDYIVESYNNDSCKLKIKDTIHVEVVPFDNIVTAEESIIYFGDETQLFSSDGVLWNWYNPLDLNDITLQNPIASPEQTTNFFVKSYSDVGCTDFDTIRIEVLNVGFYIPNAFTPNDDGENDIFKIFSTDVILEDFSVYSRWGEKIFQTDDITLGWDGTFKGKALDPDVFNYIVIYKDKKSKSKIAKGTVTLIK